MLIIVPFATIELFQLGMSFNRTCGMISSLRSVDHFSYRTSQGVVSGIQWVPIDATSVLPAGAAPATGVRIYSSFIYSEPFSLTFTLHPYPI